MQYNNCVWGGKGCRHILRSEQIWLWKKERLKIEPKGILRTVWYAMKFQALSCIFGVNGVELLVLHGTSLKNKCLVSENYEPFGSMSLYWCTNVQERERN